VSLYTFIFFHSGLFSDMGLQVVYLALSIYGWYQWLRGGENRTTLKVSRASRRVWLIGLTLATIVWLALAQYTSTLPGVALPYLDSGLTALSLLAQWMMTRKIVENWALWIVADIIYVPMYVSKHLYVTAGLYLVFLVLAIMGLISWRRSYHSESARLAAQPA
jgi:nicotinamide mononucleotide transporter